MNDRFRPRAAVHHRLLGGSAATATRLTTVANARNASHLPGGTGLQCACAATAITGAPIPSATSRTAEEAGRSWPARASMLGRRLNARNIVERRCVTFDGPRVVATAATGRLPSRAIRRPGGMEWIRAEERRLGESARGSEHHELSCSRSLPDDCLSLTLVRPCPPSASQAHPGGKVPT